MIIDAVFHAHRLQWVLDGRYYFTQPMPNGVSFPYAIGLYVFAAPWSWLTSDYVTLLRVVVTAAEVTAGALLYFVVAQIWRDRLVAVLAVLFFHTVPLPYGILGNANLTNVFGQATALVTLVVAATFVPGRLRIASFFAICALAFLSHISTFAVLSVTLAALAAWFWVLGGPALRRIGVAVLAVAVVAGIVSVAVYYGHFGEVYATALQSRTAAAVSTSEGPQVDASSARMTSPVGARLVRSARLTTIELGWPVLALAAIGLDPHRTLRRPRPARTAARRLRRCLRRVLRIRRDGQGRSRTRALCHRVRRAREPGHLSGLRDPRGTWRGVGMALGPAGQLAAAALIGIAMRMGVMQWRGWIA
jgi:hypothetical protein